MHILFICDEYPPGKNGGIGTMVQVLGRELVRQGHQITVVGLYPYYYGQKDYEVDQGVEVYRLRYGIRLFKSPDNRLHRIQNRFPKFIQKRLYGIRSFKKMVRYIDRLIIHKNIDIIEIQDWNTFNMFNGIIPKWKKFSVPLVLKAAGSYTYFCNELNQNPDVRLEEIDRLLYERADAIAAVSKYTACKVKNIFNIKKNIRVLYNGVEDPALYVEMSDKQKQMVVFTGSLLEKKGIFSLVKAWNLVYKEKPEAQLYIFGKGEVYDLKALLNENALKSVCFMGHTPRDVIYDYLLKATLAIFPSYSETFGFCAVEAMSVGCPTIYTKRSCGPEIVRENVDGLLVDPDDIEEIAEKIIKLIDDKVLRHKFSIQGRKSVIERFNIEKSAKEHIKFYQNIITNYNN